MEKIPSIEYLKTKDISFEIKTFPENTEKGTDPIAKVLGVEHKIVVKTLIYKGKSGKFYLCLVSGDGKIHSKKLKRITDEKDMLMASPNEIFEQTGYKIGAIPPFPSKNPIKEFIDSTIEHEKILYVGAGKFGYEILLSPQDLQKATDGEFVDIVKSG